MYEGSVGRVSRIGRERIGARSFSGRGSIRHLDPTLILTALALNSFGVLMVYSASSRRLEAQGLDPRTLLTRQAIFSAGSVVAMFLIASFSYRRLKAWAPVAYLGALGLLLFVLVFGSEAKGAQSWINVGFFALQPSEFAKLSVIILLALLLSERKGDPGAIDVARAIGVVLPVAGLIFLQPDLGTLLVLFAILIAALVVGGTRARMLLLLGALGVGAVFAVFHSGVLRDYQKARLTAFLDRSPDVQGTGYNLNQARIGVGSGQILGKGLFNGSQTNLSFVPEVHTDFIFVALAEETGFVGATVLLALFAVFLWRGLRIALLSKDLFGTMLAAGVVAMVAFQVFVNIGMTVGVSPITGIPLPFVSYGGSSMATTYIATGILLNVHMRRVA